MDTTLDDNKTYFLYTENSLTSPRELYLLTDLLGVGLTAL